MRKGSSFPVSVALSFLAAGLYLLVGLLAASGASAQVRVALVPFEGTGASGARRQVQNALDDDRRVQTVELDRAESAASRVGAGSGGDQGIGEVAQELEARMIIQGTVSGRGRRRRISLVARDASGQQIASSAGAMRGTGIARAVRSLLNEALGGLPAAEPEVEEEAPEIGEEEETPGGDDGDDDGGGSGDGGGGGGDAARDVADRAPMLNAQIGLFPGNRDTDIALRGAGDAQYDTWYVMLGARVEFRPLAGDPGFARGLFAHAMFAHSVGLGSKYTDMASGEVRAVDTNFYRVAFAVGMMFPLAEIFDLGIELGAGWDGFSLGENPIMESAEYIYIRPGIRARFRVLRELLGIDFDMGVRPVLSRGDFSQYGASGDTIGFDVGGGVSGGIPLSGSIGLTYGVQLGWVGYWLSYSDLASAAESGSDSGIRISLLVGLGIW